MAAAERAVSNELYQQLLSNIRCAFASDGDGAEQRSRTTVGTTAGFDAVAGLESDVTPTPPEINSNVSVELATEDDSTTDADSELSDDCGSGRRQPPS
jgi:hypothetical protein